MPLGIKKRIQKLKIIVSRIVNGDIVSGLDSVDGKHIKKRRRGAKRRRIFVHTEFR